MGVTPKDITKRTSWKVSRFSIITHERRVINEKPGKPNIGAMYYKEKREDCDESQILQPAKEFVDCFLTLERAKTSDLTNAECNG